MSRFSSLNAQEQKIRALSRAVIQRVLHENPHTSGHELFQRMETANPFRGCGVTECERIWLEEVLHAILTRPRRSDRRKPGNADVPPAEEMPA